jgi:KipI family sensor histidine kinase inhibitor
VSPLWPRILPVGEAAFTVELGDRLDEELGRQVHALDAALSARPFPGLVETVPTYRALLVTYDPLVANETAVRAALDSALAGLEMGALPQGRLVEMPVRYGGEAGPDLKDVAAHCGLTPEQVIRLYTEPTYRVAMLGFAPGFAYLFGLPPQLATPRLATPRLRIEPGSVGIAGPQTGLYALPTPGGWRIIGRTSMPLFDPNRKEPFTLRAGDRVRFVTADSKLRTATDERPAAVGNQPPSVASLEVIEGGFLTTVQDAGRFGWARFGVPPSGPMDAFALRAANILVGNAPDAASLEIALAGPVLRASHECLIAVCGAEFDVRVGSLPVPTWHAVYVRAGQEIRFGQRRSGARAYLAVSGGIVLPQFLGARSTYLPGGFGGLEGRALRARDQLPFGPTGDDSANRAGKVWPRAARPLYSSHPTLRVVLGPQDDYFTPEGLATFLSSEYEVSHSSDRMGYRFAGPAVTLRDKAEIVSDGVVTGSVQIPGDGQPIVMMADHQTTGGYPKIATVIRADLPLLAQCLPGDRVRFRASSIAEAQGLYWLHLPGDDVIIPARG